MGLFDKKYCDICGEKIGLLGNRKLEDGNLCKDCAKKLSPFFSERRHSTLDEIRQQLAYREENERQLAAFRPDLSFGERKKLYVDRSAGRFIVTSASNWRSANPDLIDFDKVRDISTDIHENKTEIYYEDQEGKRKSYNPRRYECEYEFRVAIQVDSPWFDRIELELSEGNRPDSPYTDLYRHYEEQMHTLVSTLNGASPQTNVSGSAFAAAAPQNREEELMEEVLLNCSWFCKSCGLPNNGTLRCRNCGAPLSDENLLNHAREIAKLKMMTNNLSAGQANTEEMPQNWICPSCGASNTGKFCECCGTQRPLSGKG